MQSKAKYLFRFDDICSTMNWDIWNRVEKILIDYEVRPILAVVPDNQDSKLMVCPPVENFWEKVKYWQDMGWTIALHGYQHVYVNHNPGIMKMTENSEFSTLPYLEQERKIKEGLRIFNQYGIKTKTWVAPSHSFDKNTLKILSLMNITVISDGLTKRVYKDKYGLYWIPCQIWDHIRVQKNGLWTICIHLNKWTDRDVKVFEQNIKKFANQIVSVEQVLKGEQKPLTLIEKIFEFNQTMWRCSLRRLVKKILRVKQYKNLMFY